MIVTNATGANPNERRSGSTFVTMMVGHQLCGIPVVSVRDIIETQAMTRIPLAPQDIVGCLNLRGRVVTAIDLRLRLHLPLRAAGQTSMSVVVEHQDELYSLVVDSVQEVIDFQDQCLEPNPPTLGVPWREFSAGVYQLQAELLMALNIKRVLTFT